MVVFTCCFSNVFAKFCLRSRVVFTWSRVVFTWSRVVFYLAASGFLLGREVVFTLPRGKFYVAWWEPVGQGEGWVGGAWGALGETLGGLLGGSRGWGGAKEPLADTPALLGVPGEP